MGVTLNLKSSTNLLELFGGFGDVFSSDDLAMLAQAEIYYQTHCFDLLLPRETDGGKVMVCARFTTSQTGALMQGMLGKTPMMELRKSVTYCLKHILTLYYAPNLTATGDMQHQVASSVNMAMASVHHYFNFLELVSDTKACPTAHKPAVPNTAPSKTKKEPLLDFSKLDVAAAHDALAVNSGIKHHLVSHGIYKVNCAYYEADLEEHSKHPTVALGVAEALGQRVRGTSANSVYIVAGVSKTFNVAYRVKGSGFSVRVESANATYTKTSKVLDALVGCGLDLSFNGNKFTHASLHFEGMNHKSCKRVLGAILSDLDLFAPHQSSAAVVIADTK